MKMKNDVPASKLTNALARLFRKITDDELNINPATWRSYLDDYIRKLHPDNLDDIERVKRERSTTLGNITDAIRKKESLTFKRLITGFYIIKATRVKITLDVELQSGKKVSVFEEIKFTDNITELKAHHEGGEHE